MLWREQLKTYLREDPRNILKTRYRKMADTIPSTFPRLSVLKNYVLPAMSDFSIAPEWYPAVPHFPDVTAIAYHAEEEHVYDNTNRILKMFRQSIWSGLVYREVLDQAFACVNDLAHPVSCHCTPHLQTS